MANALNTGRIPLASFGSARPPWADAAAATTPSHAAIWARGSSDAKPGSET
jgi:hypothetical protein